MSYRQAAGNGIPSHEVGKLRVICRVDAEGSRSTGRGGGRQWLWIPSEERSEVYTEKRSALGAR